MTSLFPGHRWLRHAFPVGLGIATTALAQPVDTLLPRPYIPLTKPSISALSDDAAAEEAARRETHFAWSTWGPFSLYPHISGQVVYDDNITISSTTKTGDLTWSVAPGLLVEMGDREGGTGRTLTLDYTPRAQLFTRNDRFNSLDHSVRLAGAWAFSRLSLGFNQSYDVSSGQVVDVGSRVKRETYGTGLTSHYEIDEKASFDIGGNLTFSEYATGLIGSSQFVNDDWFNLRLSSKITGGVGATFGYLKPSGSVGQTYQQGRVRLQYAVATRIDVLATMGIEVREFGGGRDPQVGPVFSLGADWSPREGTTFQITGHRDNQNSATLAGQNYTLLGVSLSAGQQFMERFNANFLVDYGRSDYSSNSGGAQASRHDNLITGRLGVDVSLTPRWLAGVFYLYRRNEHSGQGNFGFQSNQVGLHTSYSF